MSAVTTFTLVLSPHAAVATLPPAIEGEGPGGVFAGMVILFSAVVCYGC